MTFTLATVPEKPPETLISVCFPRDFLGDPLNWRPSDVVKITASCCHKIREELCMGLELRAWGLARMRVLKRELYTCSRPDAAIHFSFGEVVGDLRRFGTL